MVKNDKHRFLVLHKQLMDAHTELEQCTFADKAYVADIEDVAFEDEKQMAEGLLELRVSESMGRQAVADAFRAWRNYKVKERCSTKYVKRYAGYVIGKDDRIIDIVTRLNAIKDEIKACVQDSYTVVEDTIKDGNIIQVERKVHRRSTIEKHEFIHEVMNRTMTMQLYRHIVVVTKPIMGISYSWTHKSVPRRMDRQGAIDFIKRTHDNALRHDEMARKISDITNSRYEHFEIKKMQHAALVASLYDGNKQSKVQCTTPIILMNAAPKLKDNGVKKHKPVPVDEVKYKSERQSELICARYNLRAVELGNSAKGKKSG